MSAPEQTPDGTAPELLRRLLTRLGVDATADDPRTLDALQRAMGAVSPEERAALVAHLQAIARRLRGRPAVAGRLRPPLARGPGER
ncbi:hypothetical protein [Roseisolibacter sp. H3M3-2]|uniref:hypothetical protein n=1 Tax=Roseisolibacter sp. H3M3-2 TaxID=3031323 RepID=UPI0023D978E7|nr:hypothetical protein [Roseisolibacter sp. H3M3-2]MDF1503282.1 hypothetical protein [Roseisolibacter sp. H3M3-2]